MPFSYDPNLDPNSDQNQPGQSPQLAGGGQVMGGSATTSGSGASAGAPPPGTPTHSGNFQNLNAYLNANSGNGFGQQFSDKLMNDTGQAGQAQNQAYQNFQQKSNAGTTNANSALVQSAMSDPTGFISDPSNIAAFKSQLNAQYKGPSTFTDDQSDYQKAQGATQHAQDVGSNAQSEAGRFSLLNNYFGNSGYTQGQQGLDNLLVSNDKTAQQGIQQAAANANQAGQGFQNINNQANSYAAQNAGNTAQANLQAHNALGIDANGNVITTATQGSPYGIGAIGNMQNSLNSQVTAGQAAQTANYNRVLAELQSGNITSADLGLLGLSPQSINQNMFASLTQPQGTASIAGAGPTSFGATPNQIHTFDMTPQQMAQLLSKGPTATVGNVASASDYAKMAALSQLAGTEDTFLPTGNSSQAGSFSANPEFNTSQFQQQLNQKAQNAFNSVLNSQQENEATTGTEMHNLGAAYQWATRPDAQAAAAQDPRVQATVNKIIADYNAALHGQGWQNFNNSLNITG